MKSIVIAEAPAVDLAVAEAMAEQLDAYLVSDELYRTIVAETPTGQQRLQMTGCDLLTRLHRLQQQRLMLTPEQIFQLDQLQAVIEESLRSLPTRFDERLQLEVKSRLNAIAWFLDDCSADPKRCEVEYPFEMRNRQRIEEVLKVLSDGLSEGLQRQLERIDKQIEVMTSASPFIWSTKLEPMFPQTPYWYLYVSPTEKSAAGKGLG